MDLREQLLAATVRVVTEQGWRGATTRRIAEAAGVNEVTLFRHFGSKETLIREAMLWNAERAPIPLLPAEPLEPRLELIEWARQHYAHLVEVRHHIRRTIGEFELRPEVEDWPRRVPKHLAAMLEQYLVRLRERGLATGDWQPRAAASLLLGTLFADAISRDLMPDHLPSPAADAPRQYVELFLNAIGYKVSRSERCV
jgi:AcrR family transcriptional regulator